MNNYKNLIMICISLLLYCCKINEKKLNELLKKDFNAIHKTLKSNINNIDNKDQSTVLTTEETKKFNLLINASNKLIEYLRNIVQKNPEANQNYPQELLQRYKNTINRYEKFCNWILKDILKQKALTNSFSEAYTILENKRQQLASNKTIEEYINNGIDFYQDRKYHLDHQDEYEQYGNYTNNYISTFFDTISTTTFERYDNNEEIFERLKQELQDKHSSVRTVLNNWR